MRNFHCLITLIAKWYYDFETHLYILSKRLVLPIGLLIILNLRLSPCKVLPVYRLVPEIPFKSQIVNRRVQFSPIGVQGLSIYLRRVFLEISVIHCTPSEFLA